MDNDMNHKEADNANSINKRTIGIISILIVLGLITGIILSNFFIIEGNEKIGEYNENIREWNRRWENSSWSGFNWSKWWNNSNFTNGSWGNYSWNNSSNNNTFNWSNYDPFLDTIETTNVIFPSIGVIFLSITSFVLVGLIVTYGKIYYHSKSRYIIGLELVFISLFIISLFFINILRALYYASVVEYDYIGPILGFGVGGLGFMFIVLSIIELFGLIILFYLSNE